MKKLLLLLPALLLSTLLAGCPCADNCTGPTTREELEPNDDAEHATRLVDDDLYVAGTCSPGDPSDWFVRAIDLGDDPQDAVAAELSWTAPGDVRIQLTGPSIDVSDEGPGTLAVSATVTTAGDAYLQILCLDSSSSVTYDGRFGPAGIYD